MNFNKIFARRTLEAPTINFSSYGVLSQFLRSINKLLPKFHPSVQFSCHVLWGKKRNNTLQRRPSTCVLFERESTVLDLEFILTGEWSLGEKPPVWKPFLSTPKEVFKSKDREKKIAFWWNDIWSSRFGLFNKISQHYKSWVWILLIIINNY